MDYKRFILLFSIIFYLSGCSSIGPSFTTPVLLEEINILADQDANDGDATSLDVVICYDENLFQKLLNMKASTYFAKADELEQNNPDTLERSHFEVVAGSTIREDIQKKSNRGVGALIFADIKAPGTHRYRVGSGVRVSVKLLQNSMEVEEKENFKLTTAVRRSLSWLY